MLDGEGFFTSHFRDDLSSEEVARRVERQTLETYGKEIPIYNTPVIFRNEELDLMREVVSFWMRITKRVNSKLKENDEQLLTLFPEYKNHNDSMISPFQVPPFMRLDTLISEEGAPQIIECNALFPGNLGYFPYQASLFREQLPLLDSVNVFDSLEDVRKTLNHIVTMKGQGLTFVEEPGDSYHSETQIFGRMLDELGINVAYETSEKNLCHLRGGVVKRVIRENSSLEQLALSGDIVLANPLWSDFLNDKGLLALLRDSDFTRDFDDSLLRGIERYVPYTRFSHSLTDIEKKGIVSDKDNYVIKHLAEYGGKGVFIGLEESSDVIEAVLNDSNRRSIVQEVITSSNHCGNSYDLSLVVLSGKFSHPRVRISTQDSMKTNIHAGAQNAMCYYM